MVMAYYYLDAVRGGKNRFHGSYFAGMSIKIPYVVHLVTEYCEETSFRPYTIYLGLLIPIFGYIYMRETGILGSPIVVELKNVEFKINKVSFCHSFFLK